MAPLQLLKLPMANRTIERLTSLQTFDQIEASYPELGSYFLEDFVLSRKMIELWAQLRGDDFLSYSLPVKQVEIARLKVPRRFLEKIYQYFQIQFELRRLSAADQKLLADFFKRVLLPVLVDNFAQQMRLGILAKRPWAKELATIGDFFESGLFEQIYEALSPRMTQQRIKQSDPYAANWFDKILGHFTNEENCEFNEKHPIVQETIMTIYSKLKNCYQPLLTYWTYEDDESLMLFAEQNCQMIAHQVLIELNKREA